MGTCTLRDLEQLADLEAGDTFSIVIKYAVDISTIDALIKLLDQDLLSTPDLKKLKHYILNDHRWLPGQDRTLRLVVKHDFAYNWMQVYDVLSNSVEDFQVVFRTRPLVDESSLHKLGQSAVVRFKAEGTQGAQYLLALCELGYFELEGHAYENMLRYAAKNNKWSNVSRTVIVTIRQNPMSTAVPAATIEVYSELKKYLELFRAEYDR